MLLGDYHSRYHVPCGKPMHQHRVSRLRGRMYFICPS